MGDWRALLPQIEAVMPVGAAVDEGLMALVDTLCEGLPENFEPLGQALETVAPYSEYDAGRALAALRINQGLVRLLEAPDKVRIELFNHARDHMTPEECVPLLRRTLKDPSMQVRRRARTLLQKKAPEDVALPSGDGEAWGAEGWAAGGEPGRLMRHVAGSRRQAAQGVPKLANVGEVRALLGVSSPKQLGWLLLATDKAGGPYTTFEIPKRDGSARVICAPRRQLKAVQRRILEKILGKVPVHDAAHGFVPGRSTVTNAARHVGRALLVKFDLKDFFPTIHYRRAMGVFAHLGYEVDEMRFRTEDASRAVAPVLARLASYTPDARSHFTGWVPQGAPTSPAISNIVCRGLDNRLTGLAERLGGTYTRYADDLTFSFDALPDSGLGRFRWWVDQICQQEGFTVRQDKFRVIRHSQRQKVTGIVVNDTLRVPRVERRRFRAILHNCRTHGLASQARGRAGFPDYLRGFASYIHMVHPDEGKALLQEVEALLTTDTTPRG